MKIAVGMLHQETDSFNAKMTRLADLDVSRGLEVLGRWRGTGMSLGGALEVLEEAGAEIVPLMAVTGTSGGNLAPGEAGAVLDEFPERLSGLAVDAVYLDLHGALVAEDLPDVTGALVQRLGRVLGPDIPIAASLDCHANLTRDLVEGLDILVGFKTYPHVDYAQTGRRAAALLLQLMAGRIRPAVRVVRLPMIQPPENHDSATGPIAPQIAALEEKRNAGEILDGTFFPTQPWLDVAEYGSAVAITTDGDGARAEELARQLALEWWDLRQAFVPDLYEPAAAVRQALARPESTVMISESADAINSGAGGDSPTVIRALVEHGQARGLAFICDAAVVDELAACPPGTRREVVFGRNCDRRFAEPFATEVVVERCVDGKFRQEGLYFNGLEQDMGGAVVLKAARTHILAGRLPVFCSEPNLYRCAGLEPADYEIVSIKSPGSFRPNFAPITEAVLYLDMPGVASANLASMPWQKVRRPLFPLDREAECRLDVWAGRF